MPSIIKICSFAVLCFIPLCLSDDYYELLGIRKDANDKDIRRAFKKLALTLHPDKNIGDDKAHEKFIKINRAYEVLKDGELRKKYDLHGEEGLDENNQRNWGQNFHSWNYYQNDFGIYDDDAEIITLSYSDFEQSVKGSPDTWFINFYSPQCSHCHTLAPIWRKVGIELEGVVRIGAVNCGEDWQLCRQQGIHSYPSLKLYPENLKYEGDRTFENLISFILKKIPNNVIILTKDNMELKLKSGQPWLIFFCDFTEDCMAPKNKRKLAISLSEMVNVADVNCRRDPDVCKHFKRQTGGYFYSDVSKIEQVQEINTFDTKDIIKLILEQLPEIRDLTEKDFKDILVKLKSKNETPWLIYFLEEDQHSELEFKKLPKLLQYMNTGRMNCRLMRTLCNSYHVHKYPTFLVFKNGGGHEIYQGRMNAHDIAVFARESGTSPVRTLEPDDFPGVLNTPLPFFIDFYAPWCPPCKQLLPEWRKAAKLSSQIANFGTVDCTVHTGLCNKYNIRSYPTTILYNSSQAHQFHGHKTSYHLVEFIRDIISPTVIELDTKLFDSKVRQKKLNELWIIDFFSPWCGPCQQLSPEWRKLAKIFKNNSDVHVAQVDCTVNSQLCRVEGVRSYPNIRLYPFDKSGSSSYFVYDGWQRNAGSIKTWIHEYLPSNVNNINHKEFMEKVLHDKKPWLIDFYAPWCGHCQTFAPVFEEIAEDLKDRVKLAKVNCDRFRNTCQHADVNAYPTVKFYPGARKGSSQNMWGEELGTLDREYILSYIEDRLLELKVHVKDEL